MNDAGFVADRAGANRIGVDLNYPHGSDTIATMGGLVHEANRGVETVCGSRCERTAKIAFMRTQGVGELLIKDDPLGLELVAVAHEELLEGDVR